jgi:hypothetical protein
MMKPDDLTRWEAATLPRVERELSIDWEKVRNWIDARREECTTSG